MNANCYFRQNLSEFVTSGLTLYEMLTEFQLVIPIVVGLYSLSLSLSHYY